jgi:two-component system, LytTR family, sensor kinase
MRKSLLFWSIYGVTWLILAASHVSFFFTHLGRSFSGSVKGAVFNCAPAALFGIVVILICNRLPWSETRSYVFLSIHLLLLSLYLALWMEGSPVLNAIDHLIKGGRWDLNLAGTFQGSIFSGVMIYLATVGITYAVQTNERLRMEEARATRAESLRTRAELEALRTQLNPHFLFNTLHSLMALVRHDPPAAEDALEKLSMLLRHTLVVRQDADDCLFSEELDFIQDYLALERIRLGDRLHVEEAIEADALACRLPPLTLQPLVENSVKHAISTRAEGGLLKIRAERRNGLLILEVSDDGPGAELDELDRSAGSGLKIARQRLATRFGGRAGFKVITQPQKGFIVRMEIPAD